jgi:uncharacterized lipoprotein YmbA
MRERSSDFPGSGAVRRSPVRLGVCAILTAATCVGLTGCFGLMKPTQSSERYFVLTPLPASERATGGSNSIAVGVGPVKLASYLFNSSLAIRATNNEIQYPPLSLWAERLDGGLQRVIAGNLAALLPTDQIRLNSWRSDDVRAEVYVTVEQLEVDATGQGVLAAWWRIMAPGGEQLLKSGESRFSRQGPPPAVNPAGSVATLSELVADLSRQLATVIKDATGGQPSAEPPQAR